MQQPFLKAVPILEMIEEKGFEAYFVGGSVRDFLLGREIADVDIATSALPGELKTIFPHTADIGIQHGTILVIFNGTPYEITTFRTESGYTDYRRPDTVEFVRSLTEDLQRRDFTMNAIAMDKAGKLKDPFHGQSAIRKKEIVTVGPPEERFGEDALRIMRAVRFVGQLGFVIEPGTLAAISKLAPLLDNIAVERKLAEFEKLISGTYRSEAFALMGETGICNWLPGMNGQESKILKLAGCRLGHLSTEEMWVLLAHVLGLDVKTAEPFLRKWKLPRKKIRVCLKVLHWLHYRLNNSWTPQMAYLSGKANMLSAEKVYITLSGNASVAIEDLEEMFEKLPIKERAELSVAGKDLIQWFGKGPGPWIKDVLNEIEEVVAAGRIANKKADIREWLVQCKMNLGKD
jgi:tRNA nucleotidyltransferase (CCA-adding enzyme)